jgi:hypothetical protein
MSTPTRRTPTFDSALFCGPAADYNRGPQDTRRPILAIIYTLEHGKWKPSIVETADDGYGFDYTLCGSVVYNPNCQTLAFNAAAGTATLPGYKMTDGSPLPLHKLWIDRSRIKRLLTPDGQPFKAKDWKGTWQLLKQPLILHPIKLDYKHFTDAEAFDPFDDVICSDCCSTEYCSVCKGYYLSENMCPHVMWTEGGGCWSEGIGCSETNLQNVKRSLFDFCDVLPPEVVAILRHLLVHYPREFTFDLDDRDELRGNAEIDLFDMSFEGLTTKKRTGLGGMHRLTFNLDALAEEPRGSERYWPALAWLYSLAGILSPATTALTLGWLFEWGHSHSSCKSPLDYMTFYEVEPADFEAWMAKDIQAPLTEKDALRFPLPPVGKRCCNDSYLAKVPEGLRKLGLMVKGRDESKDYRTVHVNIAEAKSNGEQVFIQPGRIIKRTQPNNRRAHISWHEDYALVDEDQLAWIRQHIATRTFWPQTID